MIAHSRFHLATLGKTSLTRLAVLQGSRPCSTLTRSLLRSENSLRCEEVRYSKSLMEKVNAQRRWSRDSRRAIPLAVEMRHLSSRWDEEEERKRWEQEQMRKQQEMEQQPKGIMGRGAAAALAGTALLWGKAKWVIGGLKFMKLMPALSMLASTGAYAFFFGWPFAVGMVGQIAVHEAGHLAVMKALGIPAGPMVFIPFIGASVAMEDRPKDVKEEALVAFGGPVVGGAAAIGLSITGAALDSQLLIALADFGLMINLFNLLPIGSLDGGRIGGAISKWVLTGGLGAGIAMAYYDVVSSPLFYLILLSGAFNTYERFFGSGTHDSYYKIHAGQRAGLTVLYAFLIAVLLGAMAWNQMQKMSLRELKQRNPDRDLGTYGSQLEKYAEEWSKDEEEALVAERERMFVERHFGERE